MSDIYLTSNGARAVIEADTEEGIEFTDAWILGVLEVKDSGNIVVTAEVAEQFIREARARGLEVSQ